MTQRFSIEEVLLRIEAILRRTVVQGAEPLLMQTVLRYAALELDEAAHAHEVHRTVRGVGYDLRLPREAIGAADR